MTDSSFTNIAFYRHGDMNSGSTPNEAFFFRWDSDADYNWIGELDMTNAVF